MGYNKGMTSKLPETLKPLLWSFRWADLDLKRDREDIILNIVNDGRLEDWHWLIETYGKLAIRRVLARRLVSEFHPESLKLAEIVFDLPPLRHAR